MCRHDLQRRIDGVRPKRIARPWQLTRRILAGAGALLDEGHASLSADFEVSTPALDAMAAKLTGTAP